LGAPALLRSLTTVVSARLIAHVDMDAFYASVELLRYPQLQGQPVVIGGGRRRGSIAGSNADNSLALEQFDRLRSYTGRGVITTATYAARAFGLHSGMGLMKAAQLCPEAIMLPVDFDEYRRLSRLFKAAIRAVAPRVEDRGIDEVYVDLSELIAGAPDAGPARSPALALAQRIQRDVYAATGLTCSIGVSPNKLLAKLASEMNKPNGITILAATDLQEKVWPLACRKVNGIGPKAAERLTTMGLATVGDLARTSRDDLIDAFGRHHGAWLHEIAWGRDERAVVTESEPVSMSCETTFERDLHAVRDRAELSGVFSGLCRRLAADLQRKGYVGRNVAIKLRYDNFQSVTRASTLAEHTNDATAIRRAAGQCLKRAPLERRLRLLGVRVGALTRLADLHARPENVAQTLDLFDN
jgi:DNA polymerase IV